MAKTFVKGQMAVRMPNDAMLAVVPYYLQEGASQTFLNGSPVVITSGYVVAAADGATTVEGFALEDAHNSAAGTDKIKIVPASTGNALHVYANFLTTAAADNILAATDLGLNATIEYAATASSSGGPIWHAGDSESSAGLRLVGFECEPAYIPANQAELGPVAGDTNARCRFALLDTAADWAV